MPCRDWEDYDNNRDAHLRSENSSLNSTNQSLRDEIKELKVENRELEAGMCAVFNELEKAGVLDNTIELASKNGGIDLTNVWKKHVEEDLNRLKKDLEKYSHHELDMIKKILDSFSESK
jgi:predicted nuclease with TOPRIM domain